MAAVDHRERATGDRIERPHRSKAIGHVERAIALMAGQRIEGCLFRADKGRRSRRRRSRRSSSGRKNEVKGIKILFSFCSVCKFRIELEPSFTLFLA